LLLVLNRAAWRRMLRPVMLLLVGFVVFSIVIFKSQGQLDMGNVFEYKMARPVKAIATQLVAASSSWHEASPAPGSAANWQPQVDDSAMSRVVLWKALIARMLNDPYLMLHGVGIGQSESTFKRLLESGEFDCKVFGNNSISPHNSFVEILYEGGGIVGGAFLVFLASRFFNRGNWQSPWFGAWVYLICFMVFYDLLRMRYFWIVLALVEVYTGESQSQTEPHARVMKAETV